MGGGLGVDALLERVPPAVTMFEVARITYALLEHTRYAHHFFFVHRTGAGENLVQYVWKQSTCL